MDGTGTGESAGNVGSDVEKETENIRASGRGSDALRAIASLALRSPHKEKPPRRTAFPAFASLCMTDQVIEVFTGGGSTRQQVPSGIRDNARENRKGEAYQHIAQTDHLLSGGSQKII